jgi:hypothetical protein
MTNGVNALFIHNMDFSGTPDNCEALTTSPTAIATCKDLITHKNVLMAFAPTIGSTFYPTRVMWCDVNRKTFILDIASFQDVNRFEIYEGGSPIVGAVDNFGFAMIFKEDGLYPSTLVYDTGYIEMRIAEEAIRKGFSPIARHSLIARPEFCFGVAREGAFVVTPDLNVQMVSQDVQEEWDSLNPSRLQYAVAWFREKDHQVRCLLSKDSTTGHDRCLVWDWETGEVWIDVYSDAMNHATSVRSSAGLGLLSNVEYDWLGGTTGGLWMGNVSGVNEDDGASFPWEVQMAPNDFGLPGRNKTILNLRTIYRARTGQGELTVTVERDQGKRKSRIKNIPLSSSQESWDGGATWDSGIRYDTGQNAEDHFFVNRQAETIAPIFQANSPANLLGYQVEYIPEE